MISGSYWSKNDQLNEFYNFGFIENYRCVFTFLIFPDRTGPDQAGPDQAGPDQAGPDQAGPDR